MMFILGYSAAPSILSPEISAGSGKRFRRRGNDSLSLMQNILLRELRLDARVSYYYRSPFLVQAHSGGWLELTALGPICRESRRGTAVDLPDLSKPTSSWP